MWRVVGMTAILGCLAGACNGLFYFPDHELHVDPVKLGYQPQEFWLPVDQTDRISGWWFPAQAPIAKGTIVQFHGNAQNMSSHYLSLVWLIEAGYNLVTFDYRGYGRSSGEPSPRATVEDGLVLLKEAWRRHRQAPTPGIFVVVGQSLGGAIAAKSLFQFEHRLMVDLLVMDSTFLSYREVARQTLTKSWMTYLLSPLAYVLVSDTYSADPEWHQIEVPVLVIHDREDPAVPFASGQDIFERTPGDRLLWTLAMGGHIAAFSFAANRRKFVGMLQHLAKPDSLATFRSMSFQDGSAR